MLLTFTAVQAAAPVESARTADTALVRAGAPDASPAAAVPSASVAARGAAPGAPALVADRSGSREPLASPAPRHSDSIAQAKQAVAACKERYRHVHDYTCTFIKRERIDGRLTPEHTMVMKARTSPNSLYFKFHYPNKGREAIYVQGRNNGMIVAHDVGIAKFLAGTMHLDPQGSMAMEDNRHPVTEAGIGNLIDTLARRWAVELMPGESVVIHHDNVKVGDRRCTMIESVHPRRADHFLFHKVKLYIDQEYGLPIRFEAYDWPRHNHAAPELVEEYTYLELKVNVGLHDHDFDPANKQYSFGRL